MSEGQAEVDNLSGRILVVDDERNIRRTLRMVLEGEGATVVDAETGEAALEILAAPGDPIEVVLMDVKLPGCSGLEVLEKLCERSGGAPPMPIIMISGHATVEDAVKATRLGAFDFFEKPLARDRIVVSVRNGLRAWQSGQQLRALRARIRGEIVGDSTQVREVLEHITKVGPTAARVLLHGEPGTGKELVARAIHDASARRDGPFVRVNCAAIADDVIDGELFGHERKIGLFEVANGGTILLDEVGDICSAAQAKVVGLLQSGALTRAGFAEPIPVDVRVLATTSRDLKQQVADGKFREDLLYALDVVPIAVPPLRERKQDVLLLARHFIDRTCDDNGMQHKRLSDEAAAVLRDHAWPGNVRELRNVVERMVILADGDLALDDVPAEVRGTAPDEDPGKAIIDITEGRLPTGMSLRAFREAIERAFIVQRLKDQGWNVSRTAESLGVERTHLHKKMRILGISRGGG